MANSPLIEQNLSKMVALWSYIEPESMMRNYVNYHLGASLCFIWDIPRF